MAPVAEGFPGGGKERRKPHGAKAREAASGKRPAGSCPAATEGRSAAEALHRQTLRGLRRETRPVERRSTLGAPGRRRETLGSPRDGGPQRDRFQGASRGTGHKRNGGVDLSATRAGGLTGKAQAGAGDPKGREDGRESRRTRKGLEEPQGSTAGVARQRRPGPNGGSVAREALHDRMPAKLRVEETLARDGRLRSIRVRTPERSLSTFVAPKGSTATH